MTTQPEGSALRRNNVHVTGRGERALVLAHGFGIDQTSWHKVVPAFESDYRIVLFDHVGAGGSDLSAYSPRRYQTMNSYADDLLELLAELDVRDVVFVGHSMSSMVGLLAATSEPERFGKLILLNCSPRYINDGDYFGGFEQAEVDGLHETMAANFQAWAAGSASMIMGNPERPELAVEFAQSLSSMRPDIGVSISRMIYRTDVRDLLGGLTQDTLIVHSRDDIVVPRQVSEYLVQHIPNAQLASIDASGHLPHMSAPGAIIAAIQAFLG